MWLLAKVFLLKDFQPGFLYGSQYSYKIALNSSTPVLDL